MNRNMLLKTDESKIDVSDLAAHTAPHNLHRHANKKSGKSHLGAVTNADGGNSATFWRTATKKPPVSAWWGKSRMQRSKCRSLASSRANMLLNSFACACSHVLAHVKRRAGRMYGIGTEVAQQTQQSSAPSNEQ